MDKIFLYSGSDPLEKLLGRTRSAYLTFSPDADAPTSAAFKRAESREAGVSQIKRWVSTNSFSLIVIEDLTKAFEGSDISSFLLWLKDHAEDFEGPFVLIKESDSSPQIQAISHEIENLDEVLVNIR